MGARDLGAGGAVWDILRRMDIQVARPEEYTELGALTFAAYAALPGMGEMGRYGEELADVGGRAGGPGVVLRAVDGGEVVGCVTYYDRYADEIPSLADPLASLAGFRMLATKVSAQGRGVGAALTMACVERARAAGAPGIALHTTNLMEAAQRLYVRLGFDRFTEIDISFPRRPQLSVMGFRMDFAV